MGRSNLWIGIAGIAATFIAGYLGTQSSWIIAERSGAFSKAVLNFGIGSFFLDNTDDVSILFGAQKVTGGATVVAQLPYSIVNSGDATLDSTTLTWRFPRLMRRDALENLSLSVTGSAAVSQVIHSLTEDSEFHYSSYQMPSLNPGEAITGSEPIYVPTTSVVVDVETDVQGGRVHATIRVDYSLQFLVSISARDTRVQNYEISLNTAEADSIADLSEIAIRGPIASRIKSLRNSVTFFQYLAALIFQHDEEKMYLLYTELDEHHTSVGPLFFGRTDLKIRELSYRPISWQYLI